MVKLSPMAYPGDLSKTKSRLRLLHSLSPCFIYLLLAIGLTWPVAANLTTHLPGNGGDDPAIAWNLWWVKYALLNEASNPFQTDYMFYPLGINLAFYTLTLLNALTALPLTLTLGVVTASNLHMLFTFVVAAYGAFLLVQYILAAGEDVRRPFAGRQDNLPLSGWLIATMAGGFYAFAGSKLFYVALGQFNIASSHWLPWIVLYVLRTRRHPRRLKNPAMAGLFLIFQTWAELTYATFAAIFIGLYWLYWLVINGARRPAWSSLGPHLKAAGVMLLFFAAGLSLILAQMLPDMWTEGDFLVEGSGFAGAFSADLFGFVVPTALHPLLGDLITLTNIQNFGLGQHIYLGLTLLGLLLVGLGLGVRRGELGFWLIAALVFGLLCLGPVITANGQVTGIPGPFVLVQKLPFFKGNRYPSRYSVMLVLSLAVVAAFALARLARLFRPGPGRYIFMALVGLLFLFEHLSAPLPQSDMRVPPAYQPLAAAPGDFTLLDVPFAWRNGFRITGAMTNKFMFGQFYQTFHQKRLLQGNTSRNPAFKFQYFTQAPLINSLLALETGKTLPPERWAADRAMAAEALRFFNIQYIVVRPYSYQDFDGTGPITVTHRTVLPYIESVLPVEKIHDEAAISIYRVEAALPEESGLLINPAAPLAPLYFGEGWGLVDSGPAFAAQRREARLLLPLSGGPHRVTLRLRLPEAAREAGATVTLALSGWRSSPRPLSPAWQEMTFELPARAVKSGLNDARLHFSQITPLPLVSPRPDVTVISAGQEVGDFGHIFINGRQVSPNRRGYNAAILRPDGTVVRAAAFDTHLDPAASTALADFLTAAPAGSIIAVAADDEASANLTEAAVEALQGIGAQGDLRGCFRCSHAFIRASDGLVLEALEPLRPAGLTTGLGLTEPRAAAVVEWIRVEEVERGADSE